MAAVKCKLCDREIQDRRRRTCQPGTGCKSDEAAPTKPRVLTLDEAIETGSYLEILIAQRRDIVADMKKATGPAKAALHRHFGMISKEIQELKSVATEEAEDAASTPDEEWDEDRI